MITIGEWTQQRFNLLGYPFSEDVEAELFGEVDPADTFTDELQEKIEVKLISFIPSLLSTPLQVSESGFSLTRQKLTDLYKYLLAKWGAKYGLTDSYGIVNTLEDVTDVW